MMTNSLTTGAQSLEALLDSYLSFGVPKAGEIREGHVVASRNGEFLIDIGAKSEGIIPSQEVNELASEQLAELESGESVRVCVIEPEDSDGNIILSYLKVSEQDDWIKAEEQQKSGEISECEVIGYNRGGILVRLGSLRGFVPASQLGFAHQINRTEATAQQVKQMVGERISVKVLEANQKKGRLILSEMAADKELRARNRANRLSELDEGGVYEGRVINITDFGAFVDIGHIEGLVHSSELSWKHVSRPSQVLKVGQQVRVKAISIDVAKKRVTFSMKQLEPNPWEQLEEIYTVGQLVKVTITQLTRYGAFARIGDEYRLEGLIHISELSDEHVESPDTVVRKGQETTARIIRLDGANKQIGFSIKQVFSEKYMEMDLALTE